jgi:hypothetical protein
MDEESLFAAALEKHDAVERQAFRWPAKEVLP